MHYELYLKKFNVDFINKIIYILFDSIDIGIDISIYIILAYLLKCNIHKLLSLNTFYFIIILLIFYFKQPSISIIKSILLKLKNYEKSNTIFDRLSYFTNSNNYIYNTPFQKQF